MSPNLTFAGRRHTAETKARISATQLRRCHPVTHGILFKPEMIRKILAGEKWQTRRLHGLEMVNERPNDFELITTLDHMVVFLCNDGSGSHHVRFPHLVGQRICAGETFALHKKSNNRTPSECGKRVRIHFLADGPKGNQFGRTRPGIFLPFLLSRIRRMIVEVRCERLQQITPEDAIAEGVDFYSPHVTGLLNGRQEEDPVAAYEKLWKSINGADSWEKNPWVFMYEFERFKQ